MKKKRIFKFSFRKQVRRLQESKNWRTKVFRRDGFTCQVCGVTGGYLEAHHIKSFAKILWDYKVSTVAEALTCKLLWDIRNGQTLCKKCHKKTKNYRRPKKRRRYGQIISIRRTK